MAHKITFIYGTEAVEYHEEHTTQTTIRKIRKGELEGAVCKYKLDTEHDVEILIEALNDLLGWEDFAWIKN